MSWIGDWLNGMGGRKLVLAGAGLAASCVLLWFGRIDGDQWVTAFSIGVGGYIAANAIEATAAKIKGGS